MPSARACAWAVRRRTYPGHSCVSGTTGASGSVMGSSASLTSPAAAPEGRASVTAHALLVCSAAARGANSKCVSRAGVSADVYALPAGARAPPFTTQGAAAAALRRVWVSSVDATSMAAACRRV
ncbi:hypothetical protein EON67_03490 [archaeon]|nr:MAG: hypothetical protein EON67_03490 [archaeon]